MVDRKFATWEWRHPDGMPGIGVLEFEVRIEWGKGTTQSSTYHQAVLRDGPKFYIRTKAPRHKDKGPPQPEFRISSGDLTVLAEKLNDHLLGFYAVEWEDMLAVWWEHNHEEGSLSASLTMSVTPWRRGRTPTTDITYWRNMAHTRSRVLSHPPRTRVYGREREEEEDRDVDIPIVLDTPDNRAILADVAARLGMLGDRLHDLLRSDDIAAQLQQLTGLALPERTDA